VRNRSGDGDNEHPGMLTSWRLPFKVLVTKVAMDSSEYAKCTNSDVCQPAQVVNGAAAISRADKLISTAFTLTFTTH
jgi:hypothetical protein